MGDINNQNRLISMCLPKPNQSSNPRATSLYQNEARAYSSPKSSTSSGISTSVKKKLKPAYVKIFNHEHFDDPNDIRSGSGQDVKALNGVFKGKFNCEVDVISDATKNKVESTIQEIKDGNFAEQSALVIVVLSHGKHNDIISAKDGTYSLQDDMILPILNNKTLSNKPKIFYVQTCKGDLTGYQPDNSPEPGDVYIFYSTFEGYLSWRHTQNGSFFIQALCKALQAHGDTEDIDVISNRVIDMVRTDLKGKQIPCVRKTLTQKYIFGDYMHNES